jgi:hypothetical protein
MLVPYIWLIILKGIRIQLYWILWQQHAASLALSLSSIALTYYEIKVPLAAEYYNLIFKYKYLLTRHFSFNSYFVHNNCPPLSFFQTWRYKLCNILRVISCCMPKISFFTYVYFFIPCDVRRRFQSFFQKECGLVPFFNFRYLLLSLKSSSSWWLHHCPPITCILLFIYLPIACFRKQFLRKMWPNQIAFLLFIACRIFLSSLTLAHFSHNPSKLSSPTSCSTNLQNFPGACDVLAVLSIFQHHTNLCSKLSTSLVSSLNLSPVCLWEASPFCRMLLLVQGGSNMTGTTCV